MSVKIYCHRSLEELAPAHKAAFLQAERISHDLSLLWFNNLLATTFNSTDKLKICVAEDDDGQVVILPMYHDGLESKLRRLKAIANFYTSLYAPISSCQAKSDLLSHALTTIKNELPRWDQIDFSPLSIDDCSFQELLKALRNVGMLPFKYYRFGNWYLPVGGRSYADYYQGLPSRLKNTIKRKSKHFFSDSAGRLDIITGGERLEAAIADYKKVYATSWKVPEPFPNFIPGLISASAERGWLRLGIAYFGEKPVAAQIWLVAHDRAAIFKLAYDEKYASYSVGSILSAHMMQYVLDVDKVQEVDYLIGDDDYKKDWMTHRRERWGIVAYNPRTIPGLAGAFKQMLGQILGDWRRAFKRGDEKKMTESIARTKLPPLKPYYLPARPVLSLEAFGRETSYCGSVLDIGSAVLTLNARTALAHALKHAHIGQGDSVLVPAYHCPAMVSPLAWMGIEPIFYPITTDTQVDIAALEKRVKANTRALIAVHFFGFIQDFKPLRTFCDERGLLLIEDCAHAFFGNRHGQSVGQYGDYAIASIMKFLPIDEGGCLVSRSHSLADLNMRRGGWFFQFKSALNILEMACEYHRLPWLKPLLRSKEWLWQKVKPQQGIAQIASQDSAEGADSAEFLFDPDKLGVNMSIPAVAIMKAFSFSKACSKRRDNYTQLLKALGDISGGHPLFAELPDGIYPQVFPMVMDDPDSVFPILKKAGVPIIRFGEFRWQGVDASTCPVSEELSRRVFQFPCHQSLTSQELDWMIATILSVLATAREHPSHRVA